MDTLTNVLLSWQLLLISFVVFGLIKAVGLIGSTKIDGKRAGGLQSNHIWQKILPILPAVLGAGLVCVPGIPMPEALPVGWGAKILFGVAAGLAGDKTYQVVNNLLFKNKSGAS